MIDVLRSQFGVWVVVVIVVVVYHYLLHKHRSFSIRLDNITFLSVFLISKIYREIIFPLISNSALCH